jgi:DNA mismatch repair protein MutS
MKRSKPTSIVSRSIYDEYFEYDTTYKAKYGNKTCVLLEVGSFFEIYTYKTISTGAVQHLQTQDISRICNLSLVEKKATYKTDDQQIMMMGFRNYMLDKYLQKLVEADFIAVVFIQEKNGKDVTRVFDGVYSRGTFIRYDEDEDTSVTQQTHIICIWLELLVNKKGKNKNIEKPSYVSTPNIVYGISAINIFTGQTSIFEYETVFTMNPTTFDEMERFFSTFPPSEVIIISNTIEKPTIQTILRYAGVHCSTIHIISKESLAIETPSPEQNLSQQWLSTLQSNGNLSQSTISSKISNCEKQTYIQSILSSYYDNPNIYFQNSDFQKNSIATQAFCYLLDFIKEHNINLIRKIAVPVFTNTSSRLVLANHTLRQLNIINDNTTEGGRGVLSSVLSFTNRCGTAIGRRLFQRKLLNPTFDNERLETEYEKIATVLELYNPGQMAEIRTKISCIRDIEKIYRQIVLNKIYPSAVYQLYNSVCILQELNVLFKDTDVKNNLFTADDKLINSFVEFKEFIDINLYIDICKNTNTVQSFETNIIKPGISQEIDTLLVKKTEYASQLKAIYEYFNQLIRASQNVKEKGNGIAQTEYIKIHETEKGGISLQLTATRAVALKKILASMTDEFISVYISSTNSFKISFKDIHIVASGSVSEIQAPFITTLTQSILKTDEKLNIEISRVYYSIIKEIEDTWSSAITQYINYTGDIDVLFTKAFIAREYGYCRPSIDNNEKTQKSFLKATKMRHCLIEHLQTNELYVPNDVTMGVEGEDGILLFGTNAIGKTSLIRSIGVCVILAQAGLYVPCESFIYKPYTALFSRIIGNDNLFKNLSTFQVEISELAVILKQADCNSLILGDEICSSTEMESGLSIIMASLTEFHTRRASFIFATHFHEIVKWEEMEKLSNIKIKHLEVTYDTVSGRLIYDRKLKDGVGITSYGLTVCQSMNLPTEFLDNAFEIRNRHYPENGGFLTFAQSKYNTKKLIGVCEKCRVEISTEIHHIEPQRKANELGVIKTKDGQLFHKNHPANLASLCEKCHKKEHY